MRRPSLDSIHCAPQHVPADMSLESLLVAQRTGRELVLAHLKAPGIDAQN